MASLIARYKSNPEASYQKLRHKTRETYDSLTRRIERDLGSERIRNLDPECVKRIHEDWMSTSGVAMAHSLVTMLRGLATFGWTILKDKACRDLRVALSDLSFPNSKPRTERMTAEHAINARAKAREMGLQSIALAQAFQFDCKLAQKDVIGEWVPRTEPGIEYFVNRDEKWLRGLRWEEIDENLILRHITSWGQKKIEIDLKLAPMVLEELEHAYPGFAGNRARLPAKGPIIRTERKDLPWQSYEFRRKWRQVATRAGVPPNVYNMDSRASEEPQAAQREKGSAR